MKNPPYFDSMTMEPAPVGDVLGARVLAELGYSIRPTEETVRDALAWFRQHGYVK